MASKTAVTFLLTFALAISHVKSESRYYASAIIESCEGCGCIVSRYPDIAHFLSQDLPDYDNVEFKHIAGASPELVLYNDYDEEIERLPLIRLTREECNELLVMKGFPRIRPLRDEM